jgi:hypothetical protein
MKKAILSLFSCSGSIAAVLATSSIASPDAAKTIPYPEVMNLQRVPIFDARGMVPQTQIARNISPSQHLSDRSIAKTVAKIQPKLQANRAVVKINPRPMTIDLVSQTVRAAVIQNTRNDRSGSNCPGCRTLAPTVMVLGYSSGGTNGMYARSRMY